MKRALLFALFTSLFTSCAPDERIPLSECDYGLYWAECGGDGEPVLGCDRGNGDCRWFTGGETARGYAIADGQVTVHCPEGWPFSDFGPSGALRNRVVDQLPLLSTEPIARTGGRDLPVAFDLVDETYRGVVRCSSTCSSRGYTTMEIVGSSVVVVVDFSSDRHLRWELEILPAPTPDAWRARFFRIDPGYRLGPPALTCTDYSSGREYLGSGVLHLNTEDLSNLDEFHGRLEGSAREGEFPNELVFEF